MPVYQGTYYSRNFTFKDADGDPIDITGWEFESDFKASREDTASLANLTTTGGGFTVLDGPNGRLTMALTAVQTAALPVGRVVFDVLRTDPVNKPVYYFGGSVKVKTPVTNV